MNEPMKQYEYLNQSEEQFILDSFNIQCKSATQQVVINLVQFKKYDFRF